MLGDYSGIDDPAAHAASPEYEHKLS